MRGRAEFLHASECASPCCLVSVVCAHILYIKTGALHLQQQGYTAATDIVTTAVQVLVWTMDVPFNSRGGMLHSPIVIPNPNL